MKKKTVKNIVKKSKSCACQVAPFKEPTKSINCSSKVTPVKATLESEITPEIVIKKHKDPRLPAPGTTFTKKFKGKELFIEITEDGIKWEGKTYKSLSGLAMAITEYPISGYVFFHKELMEWRKI